MAMHDERLAASELPEAPRQHRDHIDRAEGGQRETDMPGWIARELISELSCLLRRRVCGLRHIPVSTEHWTVQWFVKGWKRARHTLQPQQGQRISLLCDTSVSFTHSQGEIAQTAGTASGGGGGRRFPPPPYKNVSVLSRRAFALCVHRCVPWRGGVCSDVSAFAL